MNKHRRAINVTHQKLHVLINVVDIGGTSALSETAAERVVVSVLLELLDPFLLLLLCSCFVLVAVLLNELDDAQTLCETEYIYLVDSGSSGIGTDFRYSPSLFSCER